MRLHRCNRSGASHRCNSSIPSLRRCGHLSLRRRGTHLWCGCRFRGYVSLGVGLAGLAFGSVDPGAVVAVFAAEIGKVVECAAAGGDGLSCEVAVGVWGAEFGREGGGGGGEVVVIVCLFLGASDIVADCGGGAGVGGGLVFDHLGGRVGVCFGGRGLGWDVVFIEGGVGDVAFCALFWEFEAVGDGEPESIEVGRDEDLGRGLGLVGCARKMERPAYRAVPRYFHLNRKVPFVNLSDEFELHASTRDLELFLGFRPFFHIRGGVRDVEIDNAVFLLEAFG